jgi:hypothetical protein
MAAYTAARSVHKTLGAGVADSVTITGYKGRVEVKNRSATDTIYFRTDGTAAAVGADNTDVVGPGEALVVDASGDSAGDETVSLISAGAAAYSVKGV